MTRDRFLPRLVLVTLAAILAVLVWRGFPLLDAALREPAGETRAVVPRGDLAADEQTTIAIFEGAKDSAIKSLRLDKGYRAIAFEVGRDIMFVHVNEHDKAYRWAAARRVKLDPETNRIRVIEEIEAWLRKGLVSTWKTSLDVAEEAPAAPLP